MEYASSYLKEALDCANIRRGFCAPNPSVGAVLVKDNRIIGSGSHQACGQDHAEVVAIKAALNHVSPKALKEATLYVTLEPCAHQGRTPPCTDLIIKHQLKQVIYSETDPNPHVTGRGCSALREAGIDCQSVQVDAISQFYRSYRHWCKTQRPWVTAKLAISLDGKIALTQNKPLMITGPASHAYTHMCRKQTDAILTTARTVQIDNPKLNARCHTSAGYTTYKKTLYVLDSNLNTPLSSHIFKTANAITFFHHKTVSPQRIHQYTQQSNNIRCVAIPSVKTQLHTASHSLLDLNAAITAIGKDGIHDVWVEAGGRCFQALIEADLVQRALLYVAPIWLGQQAPAAFSTSFSCFSPETLHKKPIEKRWFSLGSDAVLDLHFFL